ncbi:hypothetical protein R6Q59_004659 [Mikania micrantha]
MIDRYRGSKPSVFTLRFCQLLFAIVRCRRAVVRRAIVLCNHVCRAFDCSVSYILTDLVVKYLDLQFSFSASGDSLKKLEERGIVIRFVLGRSPNRGDSLDRNIDEETRTTKDFLILDGHEESPKNAKFFFSTGVQNWDAEFYAKRKAILGRELQPHEMWKQSHCRKGSKPMDKDLSSVSSHVSDVDSEENIEEENLVWVDERANETWAKYDGYLVEKYEDERSNHSKFDEVLWGHELAVAKIKEKCMD